MANLPRSFSPQPVLCKSSNLSATQINRNMNQAPLMMFASRKLENINCIEEEKKQYGGLFIGDIISIVRPQFIHNHKINAVLSCLADKNYPVNLPQTIVRKIIDASDSLDYPINTHFEECFNFIQDNRKSNRNVLVHCHAGISRSGAIVCAYLMKKNLWTLDKALSVLKQKRHRAKPNDNFMRQLKDYEQICLKNQFKQTNTKQNFRSSENYEGLQECKKNSKYSLRNSFQEPQRKYLNTIQNRSILTSTSRSRDQTSSIKTLDQIQSYNTTQRRNTAYDIMNYEGDSSRTKKNILEQKTNKISNNSLISLNKKEEEEKIEKQKSKATFGGLFKNKISQLIGRKTRIPWENQDRKEYQGGNIQFVDNQVSLSCL